MIPRLDTVCSQVTTTPVVTLLVLAELENVLYNFGAV